MSNQATARRTTGSIEDCVREGFRAQSGLDFEGAVSKLLVATKKAAFAITDERKDWVATSERDRREAIGVILDHFHISRHNIRDIDAALLDTTRKVIEYDPHNTFTDVHRGLLRGFYVWLGNFCDCDDAA